MGVHDWCAGPTSQCKRPLVCAIAHRPCYLYTHVHLTFPPETKPAETLVFGAIQEDTHGTQATQGGRNCQQTLASGC